MRQLTYLMGALVGAAMFTACDANGPLAVPANGRSAAPAASVAATADRSPSKDNDDKHDNDGGHDKNRAHIVTGTGDITSAVGQFRALLGDLSPNVAGEQTGNRREINWDGVPATFTNNDLFPGNFFNVNSPRGVLFTTDGPAFRISDTGYVDVNAAYAGEFNTFSPRKLFVSRGSTVVDVRFVVAGSNTPALVTGFGSVFADVGREGSTTIEYYDAGGRRLATVASPRRSDDKGLTFAGAVFSTNIVARVRITSGDTPIGADAIDNVKGGRENDYAKDRGRQHDIVAMDDFIYGEPRQASKY
ncbi:MAG: hypothetical protein ABJF01_19185 [bacterium]